MNTHTNMSCTIVCALDIGVSILQPEIHSFFEKCKRLGYDIHVLGHAPFSADEVEMCESITGHRPRFDVFDERAEDEITHIALAKQADEFIIFPSNSNTSEILQAFVQGLAHTMPTAVYLANRASIYIYERETCDIHALDILQKRDDAQIIPYNAS